MLLRSSKEGERFVWTKHSEKKMRQYRLSKKRVKRVFRNPDRTEKGIAPGTIALMQRTGTKKYPTEIWLMYQTFTVKEKGRKIKIISTWRYPGISPLGEPIPIPQDILDELDNLIKNK